MTHISLANLASQIADVGEKLSEVTIMAKVLGSLTSKNSAFQTTWNSKPGRQTMQERLIKEEARLGAESDSNNAFYWAKQGKNSEKTKLKEKEHLKKCVECFKYK